jgi:hypothetical protein
MGVDGTLSNRNFLTNDDIENKGTFYTGTNNDIFNTATNYDNSGIKDSILNSNNPYGNFGLTAIFKLGMHTVKKRKTVVE